MRYHLNAKPGAETSQVLLEPYSREVAEQVARYHESIPGYEPTPLVDLPARAHSLGLEALWVKDESRRFNLNAFKMLGASYSVACQLSARLGADRVLSFDELTDVSLVDQIREITLVTATDGNHGRGVAWIAQKLGCRAVVYMPQGTVPVRLEAIRGFGAEASIIQGTYDQAVQLAEDQAIAKGWILMQDTAWPGYESIPLQIMQGYMTLLTESVAQLSGTVPTHVFVQAGVGSLPAALLAQTRHCFGDSSPLFIVVEPTAADCLLRSAQSGKRASISGELDTIMAGLACGTPSALAWDILFGYADAFIACDDFIAESGMRLLGKPLGADARVVSGESGAVTMGVVNAIMSEPELADLRVELQLGADSRVLLVSTEGDTDPVHYRSVLGSR